MCVLCPNNQWEIHLYGGLVDIFIIFRSRCYTSSACAVAENKKHWQLDRPLCVTSWCIPSFIHSQLDLPLLHWTTLYPLDTMDFRACSNTAVCRFLLLLFPQLEKQQKAPVTGLSSAALYSVFSFPFIALEYYAKGSNMLLGKCSLLGLSKRCIFFRLTLFCSVTHGFSNQHCFRHLGNVYFAELSFFWVMIILYLSKCHMCWVMIFNL